MGHSNTPEVRSAGSLVGHSMLAGLAMVAWLGIPRAGWASPPTAQDGRPPNPGEAQDPPPVRAAPEGPKSFTPGPGIIPPSTTPEARERWSALTTALRAPGIERAPKAFDVRFEILNRGGAAGTTQPGSLDGKLRVRYLEPHFVSVALESGKESGYGPRGYYLKDGKQRVDLVGRDYETDRQSIQQALSLSKNFAALAAPAQLTLFELRIPDKDLEGRLPKGDFNWKRLDWIEILSPDFRLVEAPELWNAKTGSVDHYRVRFGLDKTSHLPLCVHLVKELDPKKPAPAEQLVFLSRFQGLNGYTVPTELKVFERLRKAREPGFREFLEAPDRELYLLSDSKLNPELLPAAFGGE